MREYPLYELTTEVSLSSHQVLRPNSRDKIVNKLEEFEQKQRANIISPPTSPTRRGRNGMGEGIQGEESLAIENDLKIENKILEKENIELAAEDQELKHD